LSGYEKTRMTRQTVVPWVVCLTLSAIPALAFGLGDHKRSFSVVAEVLGSMMFWIALGTILRFMLVLAVCFWRVVSGEHDKQQGS